MQRLALLSFLLVAPAGCQMALPVLSGPSAGSGATAEPASSRAEAACRAGARDAGLGVRGVVSVRPTEAGQEVTLAVTRGAQSFDLRCLYVAETEEARIMML